MMRRFTGLWLLFVMGEAVAASPLRKLPVWIEENHAGSFYFFAKTLPLDEPMTLVLVDAHSDASGQFDSDDVRQAIRRGPVEASRDALFRAWREQGAIQCYDWIEPLMPLPFQRVMWVAGPQLSQSELNLKTARARDELDGLAEASARSSPVLGTGYQAWDLKGFEEEAAHWPESEPVAVSIDLDFFATVPEAELEGQFDRVLDAVLEMRGLQALSFCISSPWLKSPEQAERLMTLTLDRLLLTAGLELHVEPWAECGPDHSEMAKNLAKQGKTPPQFDFSQAGPALRSLLLAAWRPEMTSIAPEKRVALLQEWAADPFLPRLTMPGRLPQADGFYHLNVKDLVECRVITRPEPVGATVQWQIREPLRSAYAMIDNGAWDFAEGAPRWPRFRWKALPEAASELELAQLAPLVPDGGTLVVRAGVSREGDTTFSPPLTLRISADGTMGFRAALSEQGRLPYLFGSTWLQGTDGFGQAASGPETALGGDCANFLIAAWRAEGWKFPWGNPASLRQRLTKVNRFTPDEVANGIGIDLGTHCAALWEDSAPLGELNAEDVVVHHLNGWPEKVRLGKLMPGRPSPQAMRPTLPPGAVTLCFGGDVMMGRGVGPDFLKRGKNPLEPFQAALNQADWAMVNLEGPIMQNPEVAFCAQECAADWLRESGIDAVSLANNHAGDAGAAGLARTMELTGKAGLQTVREDGPGMEWGVKGLLLSVFAWHDDGGPPPERLLSGLARARAAGRWPLVFVHWGTEHSPLADERQRLMAREIFGKGANLIVGAGPHVLQKVEPWGSGVVAWSLGNLVFDGAGPGPDWRRGGLLTVTIDPRDGKILRHELREIQVSGPVPGPIYQIKR